MPLPKMMIETDEFSINLTVSGPCVAMKMTGETGAIACAMLSVIDAHIIGAALKGMGDHARVIREEAMRDAADNR